MHASRQQGSGSPSVIIIGCGMSGMLMGMRLQQAGMHDFTILEKAHTLGGTWRENRYPGLACDVPAYMYTYSFAPNTECRHRYARGPELQAYFERVFAQHALAAHTRFNSEAVAATFADHGWTVTLASGETLRCDFLVSATGVLHHPSYPDIPGLDSFAGSTMHSARWDDRVETAGKRIGIIGTGSTAAQLTSALVADAGSLSLFQRTAQWVAPCFDTAYSRLRLPLLRRLPGLSLRSREAYRRAFLPLSSIGLNVRLHRLFNLICRLNLRLSVRDPVLRRQLTPDYAPGCKRLILSDTFYRAIQQPNATLVTDSIAGIEPAGVRTRDGRLHALDVLVLATGFKALKMMWPMQVTGAGGITLDAAWRDGPRALRTVSVPGFPNLFMLQGPHGPVGNFSLIDISECQADHILRLIQLFRDGRYRSIAPRPEATERYNQSLRAAARETIWASGCQSWYLDKEGVPAIWPWDYHRFEQELGALHLDEYELAT